MKRLISFISFILLFATVLTMGVYADGEATDNVTDTEAEDDLYAVPSVELAPYVYLYNFENDTVLFEKGTLSDPVYPTATVKIMSGIVAIEALKDDLDRKITVTSDMLSTVTGNRVGFRAGEIVSCRDMLYCMLVNNANDAAIILAHAVAGSVDEFVNLMNDKAYEIGALSTSYTNPTGMHDNFMVTTTEDTIAIAKYAYNIPLFMEIVGTGKYVMDETNMSDYRNIFNRNNLMSKVYRTDYYYENAIGMNAGNTTQGKYCSVTAARSDDGELTYLCVIMNTPSIPSEVEGEMDTFTSYSYAIELFDWAFRSYGYREVLKKGTIVCELPVSLSTVADYVTLVPTESVTVYMPTNVDIKSSVKITHWAEENVKAPIEKGQVLGWAKVMYEDREIGRVDLVATVDISKSALLETMENISEFAESRFFIATVISAVVFSVLYVLLKARIRQKRLRNRVPRRR